MEEDATIGIKRRAVEKAVSDIIGNANVPAHVYLRVVRALHKAWGDHQKTIGESAEERERFARSMKELVSRYDGHLAQIESYKAHIGRTTRGPQGETGPQGIPGRQGEKGPQGEPGISPPLPDIERMVQEAIKKMPPQDSKDLSIPELARSVVTHIRNSRSLDMSHIAGAQKFIKDGIAYRVEELMHGGGSSGGIGTVYSEVMNDSGDHQNFTAAHTISKILSLMDGTGKGIPLKDASGAANYTFTGTTLTLSAPDANIASAGINIIYA